MKADVKGFSNEKTSICRISFLNAFGKTIFVVVALYFFCGDKSFGFSQAQTARYIIKFNRLQGKVGRSENSRLSVKRTRIY